MIFKVIVQTLDKPVVREVEVPSGMVGDTQETLDAIFQYGQNDFQSRKCPSVSVGDFIIFFDDVYVVEDFGFKKLEKVGF